MLPVVSSSPSTNIRDFVTSDQLFTLDVENVLSIRSLSYTNRLQLTGPAKRTLVFLLIHGFLYHSKIDYVGKDVCVWRRREAFREPQITAQAAQRYFLTDTLPTWVDEVIVYEEENVVAMAVPKLFPAGFGSSSASAVIEKLLTQGFVSGRKVDTPLGQYWLYTRTVAYVPALAAQAVLIDLVHQPGQQQAAGAAGGGAAAGGGGPVEAVPATAADSMNAPAAPVTIVPAGPPSQ